MDKAELNGIATHPLQSSYWADFRKDWGNEILETEYGIITIHKIPLTKYKIGMFIRGPEPTKKMLSDLKKIAKENNLIFIKLEPNLVVSSWQLVNGKKEEKKTKQSRRKLEKFLRDNGCVAGKTLFTPSSFQIDLTKSEEELLKSFHHKTRYNIRYAKRKGIKVVENNSDKAFKKYLELTRKTVERQGFFAHNENYHRLMWQHLHQTPNTKNQKLSEPGDHPSRRPIAHLLTAKYKGKIITTWILFVWKDMLYYPYGASSMEHKNVQANSLMMWEAIRFGKKLELKRFDLWGREPGKGFTKFKEGFNPKVVEYLGTWDLIVNKPLYYFFRIADSVRWSLLRTKANLGLTKYSF
ncbi:peptidoglycan bridge formation glycyltransferase FemA/FemB family protein [Candidatus Woesebacteria bacterium]|nr:peptidoglycan bridge formation glycyltransferase FemA/FemB family protein [Candidatus Woesebacteria bacterium]